MTDRVFVRSRTVSVLHCPPQTPTSSTDTRHCHDKIEILYIVSGAGELLVEGAIYPIKPGMILLLPAFAYHTLRLDPSVPYERYVINFNPVGFLEEVNDLLTRMLDLDTELECGLYFDPEVISPNAHAVFERLAAVIPMEQRDRVIYTRTMISELVLLFSLAGGEKLSTENDELGARLLRYLNENIERGVSLDDLARRFFLSKYYLCRAFKKHNGISIHGYVNIKRVMFAKRLIDSGVTASVAAERVGFGDYSSFYRAYVKAVGKAPTTP